MLSTVQMIILVISVMVAGAVAGIVFYFLEKREKPSQFSMIDFSNNYVAPKMQNTDNSIDDVIKNFKILN